MITTRIFKRYFLSLLLILIIPSATKAQQSLWVGQSYTFDVTSAVMGLTANMSWSTSGGYLSLSGSGFYRTITVTQYFSGSATVTCEWDYKLTSNSSYTHMRKSVTITCRENKVSISPSSLTLSPGETSYVSYSHQYDNQYTSAANTYFQSTNPSVAAVNQHTGEVTAKAPGSTYINVYSKISSGAPYCLVTVKEVQPTSISIPHSLSLVAGDSKTISATLSPSNASSSLTWTSSNTNVATVSQSGNISALNPGTTNIKVTTANGLTATCALSVSEPEMDLVSSAPDNNSTNVSVLSTISAKFTCDIFEGTNFSGIKLIDAYKNIVSGTASLNGKQLSFQPTKSLSALTSYTLQIPEGAIKNKWNTLNTDSYAISFKTGDKEKLSLSVTPEAGIVEAGTSVALTCSNSQAQIYYTIDNLLDPYKKGVLYNEPLKIEKSTTIKAYATMDGYIDSDLLTVSFIVNSGNSTTSTAYLSVENTTITSDEPTQLEISLMNPDDQISFVQFDVYLPNNITLNFGNFSKLHDWLTERGPANERIVDAQPQIDGSTRFIIASYENACVEGTSGTILNIPIVADEGNYNGTVYINNVELVTSDEKIITPSANYSTITVDYNTGIENIDNDGKLVIHANNGTLTLLAYKSMTATIYRLNGTVAAEFVLEPGIQVSLNLPTGIYIINKQKIKI